MEGTGRPKRLKGVKSGLSDIRKKSDILHKRDLAGSVVLGMAKGAEMGKIRSRLVTYTVTAKDREAPNSDNWVQWEITLQGNRIREDRADWLKDARKYFSDIRLTRVTAASTKAKAASQNKADIAREGLAILDEIVKNRTNQHA